MFTFPTSFFVTTATTSYSTTLLGYNPAIYWRLEETSGTTISDTSTNNISGTISGTYTLNQSGSLNDSSKSIYFNNGVIQQSSNIIIPSSNYTIILRAKTSASNAGLCVFTNNASGAASYAPGLYLINNKAEFYYYTVAQQFITSTDNYNDNNWHSYAFSISSNGAKLYVDGNLIANNSSDTNTASYSGFWLVGKTYTLRATITPINGNIDEFAYFATALNDSDIATIHQSI